MEISMRCLAERRSSIWRTVAGLAGDRDPADRPALRLRSRHQGDGPRRTIALPVKLEVFFKNPEIKTKDVQQGIIRGRSPGVGGRPVIPGGRADKHPVRIKDDRALLRRGVMQAQAARDGHAHLAFQVDRLLLEREETAFGKIGRDVRVVGKGINQVAPRRRCGRKAVRRVEERIGIGRPSKHAEDCQQDQRDTGGTPAAPVT